MRGVMGKSLAVIAALAAFGCGSRPASYYKAPLLLPPAAIDDRLVLVDGARNEARLLDVSGATAPRTTQVVPLVTNPFHTEPRNGHADQLLVLSAGQADGAGVTPAQPGLTVLGASGAVASYRYDPSFNAMTQSPDGRYVFLFFDSSAGQSASTVLFNPNEVALIDLEQKQVYSETLRSFGDTPHAVAFSSADVPISTGSRRLAVALFDSSIEIFDLSHLDRARYSVVLTAGITLSQVVFSTTEPKMYLRASGSDDVFVVTLSGATPEPNPVADGGALNDFTPSLNQLPAGTGPSDIALYADGTATRLLALSPGTAEAVIVDADSSNTTEVPLPTSETNILLYQGPKPSDPTVAPRALLYSTGTTVVTFLDLVGIEERGRLNVDTLTIEQPFASVTSLDGNLAMFVHSGTGLSVVDLGDRTVTPISGPSLASAISDPLAKKLWLAPQGGQEVAYLDLDGFRPNQVHVDAPIVTLVPVPSASTPRVVVTHPDAMGYSTVLDARDPTNLGAAYAMRGYLFQGVTGEGSP